MFSECQINLKKLATSLLYANLSSAKQSPAKFCVSHTNIFISLVTWCLCVFQEMHHIKEETCSNIAVSLWLEIVFMKAFLDTTPFHGYNTLCCWAACLKCKTCIAIGMTRGSTLDPCYFNWQSFLTSKFEVVWGVCVCPFAAWVSG